LLNPRRRRLLTDISVEAIVRNCGLFPNAPNNTALIKGPLLQPDVGFIGLAPRGGNRIISLDVAAVADDARAQQVLPPSILNGLRSGRADLRGLLRLHDEATVVIWIGMADGYSGLRRVIRRTFREQDIEQLLFKPDSVERGRHAEFAE